MKKGRIVKILENTTTIYSNNVYYELPFKTKHALYDIINEQDQLIVKSYTPINFMQKKEYYLKRLQLLQKTKDFFKENGFVEAITPKLKEHYLNERNIKKIKAKYGFLVPSFEIELKKLLCLGFERVFEINYAYRNDFEDCLHKKEFLMLEWYRAWADPLQVIEDFKNLCIYLNDSAHLQYFEYNINLSGVKLESYENLFLKFLKIDIKKNIDKKRLIAQHNLPDNLTKWQVLDYLFSTHIEKNLGTNCINVVHRFPPFTFLAKKDDNGWSKRFELYIAGIELANSYNEENNFLELKKYLKLNTDKEFTNFMAFGMPDASGIALGLDRLLMLITGLKCL